MKFELDTSYLLKHIAMVVSEGVLKVQTKLDFQQPVEGNLRAIDMPMFTPFRAPLFTPVDCRYWSSIKSETESLKFVRALDSFVECAIDVMEGSERDDGLQSGGMVRHGVCC